MQFGKLLDQSRCIGCHACTTACKSENEVPLGVSRTYVKTVESGTFPSATRSFQVTRCNQCVDAPCVTACPTSAMFRRHDGIVDFDKQSCIGCKACIAACPYDAIFINPDDHSAEKCNFCAHRLDVGLEPACVVVCPVEAIIVGDLLDPTSKIARVVGREPTSVRRPEKDTKPKVFYTGASMTTLDPLAAARPRGGIFAWAQQPKDGRHQLSGGVPERFTNTSQASVILSYDVAHSIPWDWRVGLYTWTKSVAAGVYLVAAALVLLGVLDLAANVWRWMVPIVGLIFLGATGAILIWDLEHPARFYYVFTRPHWASWLVRGAVAISGFGAVLTLHLVSSLLGYQRWSIWLIIAGAPFALATSIYTAFLFAQARARDLWQNPLLPAHFAVQAVLAGAAVVQLCSEDPVRPAGWTVSVAATVHLVMTMEEICLPHGTTHARLAVHNLTHGRVGRFLWTGVVLTVVGTFAPWHPLCAIAALAGLLMYEHAYVQAGQSVPLA